MLVGVRVTDPDESAGLDLTQHSERAYLWVEEGEPIPEPVTAPID